MASLSTGSIHFPTILDKNSIRPTIRANRGKVGTSAPI
jgi:hypothetical protein